MSDLKGTKFLSGLLSTTVVVVNSFSINAMAMGTIESNHNVWMTCNSKSGVEIKCDDTNTYSLIKDPNLIKKLEREFQEKEIDELISTTISVADEEISKFVEYLKNKSTKEYKEPSLRFGILTPVEEYEFKQEVKEALNIVKKNSDISYKELYNNPKLHLKKQNKKKHSELINSFRRNNYAVKNDERGEFIAAGIVSLVLHSKMDSKVDSKSESKMDDKNENHPFKKDFLKKRIDYHLKPYADKKMKRET